MHRSRQGGKDRVVVRRRANQLNRATSGGEGPETAGERNPLLVPRFEDASGRIPPEHGPVVVLENRYASGTVSPQARSGFDDLVEDELGLLRKAPGQSAKRRILRCVIRIVRRALRQQPGREHGIQEFMRFGRPLRRGTGSWSDTRVADA